LKTPDDLSVVGFDDSLIAQLVWPSLTTCRQPIADMAAAAVSMLASKEEIVERATQLQHEIVIRESTAPPRKS
jgi:LacI family transcriptional regulator